MLSLALLALALLLQAPAGTLTLDGQVVALGSTTPVANARIVVAKVGGAVSDYRTGVTDANGRFAFRDLTAGSYRVFAERQGYVRGEYGRRVASGAGTPVWLVEGQPTRITVTMIPTGAISGRILDNGQPMRNVWVRALRSSFFDGQRTLIQADYTKSDDLGEYRLHGLAPGIYYVSAIPRERPRIEGDTYVEPTIPSNANGNRSSIRTPVAEALARDLVEPAALDASMFLPAFFPGTTDDNAAAAIEVQPGRTVNGIDVTIARSPTVRVRGRVTDATTGKPAQNVVVQVGAQQERTPTIAGGLVDASGTFELPAVPAGRYSLTARSTTSSPRLFGTAQIEVRDRNVDNLEIVIRPGTTLRGHASIVGTPPGGPPPLVGLQLNGVDGGGYSVLRLGADGTFTVENVEAREYRVRIVARGFRAPKSVRFGADDVTGRSFRFGPDVADTTLEVVIDLSVGGLDVAVVDSSQRPIQGVTVALVPDAVRRNQSSLFRTGSTDNLGRLRLDDVIPGEYLLFTDDVDPPTWQDPEVLRRYESRGTRVRVVEDARQNVTLRIR